MGEWLGWVLGLYDAVLCGDPVHSAYDHSLPLHPLHSRWSSHQRPEVSHKYSSLDGEGGNQLKRMKNTMFSPFHFLHSTVCSYLPESDLLSPPLAHRRDSGTHVPCLFREPEAPFSHSVMACLTDLLTHSFITPIYFPFQPRK